MSICLSLCFSLACGWAGDYWAQSHLKGAELTLWPLPAVCNNAIIPHRSALSGTPTPHPDPVNIIYIQFAKLVYSLKIICKPLPNLLSWLSFSTSSEIPLFRIEVCCVNLIYYVVANMPFSKPCICIMNTWIGINLWLAIHWGNFAEQSRHQWQ